MFYILKWTPLAPSSTPEFSKKIEEFEGKVWSLLKDIWRALLVCCESWFPLNGRNWSVFLLLSKVGRGVRGKSESLIGFLCIGEHARLLGLTYSWDTCCGAVVGLLLLSWCHLCFWVLLGQRMCECFQGIRVAICRNKGLSFIFSKRAAWNVKKSSAGEDWGSRKWPDRGEVALWEFPNHEIKDVSDDPANCPMSLPARPREANASISHVRTFLSPFLCFYPFLLLRL